MEPSLFSYSEAINAFILAVNDFLKFIIDLKSVRHPSILVKKYQGSSCPANFALADFNTSADVDHKFKMNFTFPEFPKKVPFFVYR
jgi:hypothetical protein